jgi:hypothetical protein
LFGDGSKANPIKTVKEESKEEDDPAAKEAYARHLKELIREFDR